MGVFVREFVSGAPREVTFFSSLSCFVNEVLFTQTTK